MQTAVDCSNLAEKEEASVRRDLEPLSLFSCLLPPLSDVEDDYMVLNL